MKLKTTAINVIAATLIAAGSGKANEYAMTNPGFGTGTHYKIGRNNGDEIVSVLKKPGATYCYVSTGPKSYEVRRIVGGGEEILYAFKPGAPMLARLGEGESFLVDAKEENGSIRILLLLAQSYFYMELVKNYPPATPPPDDAYLPDPKAILQLPWKPVKCGEFHPDGFDMLDFRQSIGSLKSISLGPDKTIELRFKEGLGTDATYSVIGDEILKNGKVHERLVFNRTLKLESEYFDSFDSLDDEKLKKKANNMFVTESGELRPELIEILDSAYDTARAQALKARLESLIKQK